ncbi:hypothetical protein [Fenollaria timonensis]|uniref:hypothetical protein n=1 Tax=Fenollaria timonensis TaxID=1723384 RepID=UPI0026F2761F|nr:hypothetical protein [Fenollaria timonensis]
MVDIFKRIKGSSESLMMASGSLYVKDERVDDEGYTRETYTEAYDFKCRLSFNSNKYELDDKNARSDVESVLFTPYEVVLKEGSLVKLTQNEVNYFLIVSKVKAYSSHREYSVKEVEKWL